MQEAEAEAPRRPYGENVCEDQPVEDDPIRPSEILSMWLTTVGPLPHPGKFLLHRAPEVVKLLRYPKSRAAMALSAEAVRRTLAPLVETQIEDAVDEAMRQSTRVPAGVWLQAYWVPVATDEEIQFVALHALENPRALGKIFAIRSRPAPALSALMRLRHDTRLMKDSSGQHLLVTRDVITSAVTAACQEAWGRALISNADRRKLLSAMPVRIRAAARDDWFVLHWWTGE